MQISGGQKHLRVGEKLSHLPVHPPDHFQSGRGHCLEKERGPKPSAGAKLTVGQWGRVRKGLLLGYIWLPRFCPEFFNSRFTSSQTAARETSRDSDSISEGVADSDTQTMAGKSQVNVQRRLPSLGRPVSHRPTTTGSEHQSLGACPRPRHASAPHAAEMCVHVSARGVVWLGPYLN